MTQDDMHVVAYKILKYLDQTQKEGVPANFASMKEAAACNEQYFQAVLDELFDRGLIKGTPLKDMNGDIVKVFEPAITLVGADYLENNSTMNKVAKAIGTAFGYALPGIIEVAKSMPL